MVCFPNSDHEMFSKESNFNFNFIHSISIYNFTIASTRVEAGEETHKFKEKKGKKKYLSNYAYICTLIHVHKTTFERKTSLGHQNKQAKKSILSACVQVLAAPGRHSRGLAAKNVSPSHSLHVA